jgi:hypothetical protein
MAEKRRTISTNEYGGGLLNRKIAQEAKYKVGGKEIQIYIQT